MANEYYRGEIVAVQTKHSSHGLKTGRVDYERFRLARVTGLSRDKREIRRLAVKQYGQFSEREVIHWLALGYIYRIGHPNQGRAQRLIESEQAPDGWAHREYETVDALREAILAA